MKPKDDWLKIETYEQRRFDGSIVTHCFGADPWKEIEERKYQLLMEEGRALKVALFCSVSAVVLAQLILPVAIVLLVVGLAGFIVAGWCNFDQKNTKWQDELVEQSRAAWRAHNEKE